MTDPWKKKYDVLEKFMSCNLCDEFDLFYGALNVSIAYGIEENREEIEKQIKCLLNEDIEEIERIFSIAQIDLSVFENPKDFFNHLLNICKLSGYSEENLRIPKFERLNKLRDQGAIKPSEYESLRSKILAREDIKFSQE